MSAGTVRTAVLACVPLVVIGDLAIAAAGSFEEGTVKTTTLAVGLVGLGCLVAGRNRRMAALLGVTGLGFAALLLCAGIVDVAASRPDSVGSRVASGAALGTWLLTGPTTAAWIALLLVFPSGRFTSTTARRAFAMLATLLILACVGQYLTVTAGTRVPGPLAVTSPPGAFASAFAAAVLVAMFGALLVGGLGWGLVSLGVRFRAAAGANRQQLKWLMVVLGADVIAQLLLIPLTGSQSPRGLVAVLDAGLVAVALGAIGMAITGRRLWWIDAAIPWVAAVLVVWIALSIALVLVAVASGARAAPSTQVVGVPVAVALAVAIVAVPLRRRVETALIRQLYGGSPRGFALLAHARRALAEGRSLEEWGASIAEALCDALDTPWSGLWLARAGDSGVALRCIAVVGGEARTGILPAGLARALTHGAGPLHVDNVDGTPSGLSPVLPGIPAIVVPVCAEIGSLSGLVACGRSQMVDAETDTLILVASELSRALRTHQLEGELQERIAEIEEQSSELRRSRQRLVTAQDAERRRIGRDLHDGAQQHLVALAARLRGIARSPRVRKAELTKLADEAEDAVFLLADLARGIHPSTLTDHGLATALRQQAGRTPLRIHLAVQPGLAERRFDADVEMALYYVALEALTNVQKHAPTAACSMTFRTEDGGCTLILELRDDGPGFETRTASGGHGLLNMADRVAAVGGDLRVDGNAGEGTWVTARVPVGATVLRLEGRSLADR